MLPLREGPDGDDRRAPTTSTTIGSAARPRHDARARSPAGTWTASVPRPSARTLRRSRSARPGRSPGPTSSARPRSWPVSRSTSPSPTTIAPRGRAGRRLVYGGHTIGIAAVAAHPGLARACSRSSPGTSCDHLGPVFEGDTLRSTVELEALDPLASGRRPAEPALARGRPARARLRTSRDVLDWRLVRSDGMSGAEGILGGLSVIEGSAFVAAPLGGSPRTTGSGCHPLRIEVFGGGLDYGR